MKVVDNVETLTTWFTHILSLLNYFIWGFGIAYLLNPIVVYIEKKTKIHRSFSILITYTLFLGLITFAITLISPKIANSIADLLGQMPDFIPKAESWINSIVAKYIIYDKYGLSGYIEDNINAIVTYANNLLKSILNLVFSNLINFTSTMFKLVSGIVISVYFLKDKEVIIKNIKKFIYSILNEATASSIINFGNNANEIFSRYVLGRLIDSLLIGIICFAGLEVLNIPYALLLSFIIGITNMIPYFGNVIGLVPASIITLFSSPLKTLELIIFIMILSQMDGWFLSPRIIGRQIGISPLLIILAIAVGGSIFGIIGLFLGVPVMAVIKALIEHYINRKLEKKGIQI
jgi:predicted PurR-regulated permease PerM